jgi:UDP-N-acetylmuramoyl-tripeptide--D-alanyl-D-alanine ligase
MNALAVTAATLALGIAPELVRKGLESVRPVHGRFEQRKGANGSLLIDDTYNANPGSLHAGMEVLAGRKGCRLLALGDMAELGEGGAELHAEAGRTAKTMGLDGLYATGELARHAVDGFGEGGRFFKDQSAMIEALLKELGPTVTLLVKGSRSRRMEHVVEALVVGDQ